MSSGTSGEFDFKTWKARLMKTLALLHVKTDNPEEKQHIQKTMEMLRYRKSRDITTIIYLLYDLVSKYNRPEISWFIETVPIKTRVRDSGQKPE